MAAALGDDMAALEAMAAEAGQAERVHLAALEGEWETAARHYRVAAARGPYRLRADLEYAAELSARDLVRVQALVSEESTGGSLGFDPPLEQSREQALPPADRTPPRRIADLFVGQSPAARAVRESVVKFAALDAPVLLIGETGTGKEVVARLLYSQGTRTEQPFVPVNCGAVSDALIESELFGHVRGAFTGASRDHKGVFESAGTGVIFLDEVHAMSPRLQVALLRVLESGEFRPVGGTQVRQSQARVIAATNERIVDLIEQGEFRADLYYRLARLHIHLPPLRDRKDDIASLVRAFLRRLRGEYDVAVADDFIAALSEHDWPGNVRELRNEVERIVLLSGGEQLLTAAMFQPPGRQAAQPAAPGLPEAGVPSRAEIVGNPRNMHVRRERLRRLFDVHAQLTRAQVIELLRCAPDTATRDLRSLVEDGYIARVDPTGHPKDSYFVQAPRDRAP